MNPPMLRAPNGVMEDGMQLLGRRQGLYDPGKITVPTLLFTPNGTPICRAIRRRAISRS